ncbi:prepilin peptidase [Spirillospora sp. CA-255316]
MSAETDAEPSPEPVWSWRADWTEPVRRHPVRVALCVLLVETVLAVRNGLQPDLAALAYLGFVGTALGFIDVRLRRLPDPLTLPSYPIGIALLGAAAPFTAGGGGRLAAALVGLLSLGAVFAIQWFCFPAGLGFGDVKLSGVLGLYLGWFGFDAWMFGVLAMFVLGGSCAVGLLVLRRAGRKDSIPFGPFMLLGTLAGVAVHA